MKLHFCRAKDVSKYAFMRDEAPQKRVISAWQSASAA
jgi:hypothetical protein